MALVLALPGLLTASTLYPLLPAVAVTADGPPSLFHLRIPLPPSSRPRGVGEEPPGRAVGSPLREPSRTAAGLANMSSALWRHLSVREKVAFGPDPAGVILILQGGSVSKVYIVRHGESLWNLEHRLQGAQDPALSEAGYQQAARVAKALEGLGVAAVYSSPLRRASETARVIAGALRVPLHVHADLREMSLGTWEGRPLGDLLAREEKTYRAWLAAPADCSPPGGERMGAFAERVMAALSEVREKSSGQDIALVTHGVVARVLVARTLGLDLNQIYRMRVSNGSVSCLIFDGDFPRLAMLNQVAHLTTRIGEDPHTLV